MSANGTIGRAYLLAFAAGVVIAWVAGVSQAADRRAGRELLVQVSDTDGEPIADASVEALSRERSVAVALSDAHGQARLVVPDGTVVRWVVALKSGAGLDYRALHPPGRPVGELPDWMSLTLDGARTIRIVAVDMDERPIAGVRMTPWIIGKSDKRGVLNLSASFIANALTDANGVATFDWAPRNGLEEPGSTFLVQSPGLHWPDPPENLFPGSEDVRVVARLHRGSVITGTVTLPAGRPAQGLSILAEGRGDSVHVGRAIGRTKLDGSYSLGVPPRQSYTVSVVDDSWAASRFGVAVGDDTTVAGVDLAARRGVRIHGRMTRADGAPVAGELVLLGLRRAEADGGPPVTTGYWGTFADVTLQRSTWTDADGRYAFRVGAGDYLLCAVGATPGSIHDPLRVSVEAHAQTDTRIDLTRSTEIPVLGNSAAPFKASSSDLYEYAFLPAWTSGRSDGPRACTQCHRPHGGVATIH